MIVYPNAKLNLGLQIVGRRADGYHLLSSCFYPIPLCDTLEILLRENGEEDLFVMYGSDTIEQDEHNLVLKAIRKLREHYTIPSLEIYLHKHIPSGAGMGGGSADASFTLRCVNDLLGLGISQSELEAMALELGADCPFFIANCVALAEGIGEKLTPLTSPNLTPYNIVIVKPDFAISTAEAFRGLKHIGKKKHSIKDLMTLEPKAWQDKLHNDFEDSLFPLYPQLGAIKEELYRLGADYVSMTGSGSAIYALFEDYIALPQEGVFEGSFVWQSKSF